jgi:hypothetical protein
MASDPQQRPTPDKKPYLRLGILAAGFLIVVVAILFQTTSQGSPGSPSSTPTLQINLPTVEYPTIPPSAPDFTVSIQSMGPSGITGTATFKDIAGAVAILLKVDGPPTDEEEESIMPAEIHYGTCAAPGTLAYPMSPPDAGESETDLSINLKQFNTQKPMAVILYRSLQDHTAIACGDVQ